MTNLASCQMARCVNNRAGRCRLPEVNLNEEGTCVQMQAAEVPMPVGPFGRQRGEEVPPPPIPLGIPGVIQR